LVALTASGSKNAWPPGRTPALCSTLNSVCWAMIAAIPGQSARQSWYRIMAVTLVK
jgi:hypothetical protein